MKKITLKKVMFSVGTFLFATCLGLGAGMLKTPVQATTLTNQNNFSGLDTTLSTGDVETVSVGDVANNYLVVNRQLGGTNGINVDVEVDVTFTRSADALVIGMLPTIDKDAIAQGNIVGNGLENGDYVKYWNNGTQYRWTSFKNNTLTDDDSASAVQDRIVGNVLLKLAIKEWGAYDICMKVPSSNMEMPEDVQRNEWIKLATGGSGVFQEYEVPDRNGVNAIGYAFFSMKNVIYNRISIVSAGETSINNPSLNDDFSDPSTFETNYVTNDAFDNGVAQGNIVLPKDSVIISSSTTTDIATNHTQEGDMFYSTQAFKGAMRLEISLNSFGPTAYLGFKSLAKNDNVYIRTGLQGLLVYKYGEVVCNEFGSTDKWETLLNESGAGAMGGDFKIILDVNEEGDATISLQVVNKTYGDYQLSKSLYEIMTIKGLCADVVTDGGYVMFGATHDDWVHITTIQDIKLTNAKGEVLLEDDFSCNNVNGEGARLWTLTDSTNLYTLPGVNVVSLDNGTVYVNVQNTANEKEKLTVEWIAQVVSGEMTYYFGMDEKATETATAYASIKDGTLTFTQGDTKVVLAENVDFTQKTRVKLVFDNLRNKAYVCVNDEQTGETKITVNLTGYMGIYATKANLTYLNAEVVEAPNVVNMQAGAYIKANTTLKDSGIRFATVIDKAWYDEMKADDSVDAITYGTLILPTDYLPSISAFTLEGLEASGKNYINAVVEEGFTNETTATEDGYYQYMGGIKNILPANYTRNFSAVGYVTVTFKSGETKTYYTEYCKEDHSRNIYQLAERTYGDRSTEKTGQYTEQLKDGTWAKYSQEVMDVMYQYLDGVVNIEVKEDGTISNVGLNEYYQASYQVVYTGNEFIVESDTEIKTILVNGVRQKDFTKGINGEKHTATFTIVS